MFLFAYAYARIHYVCNIQWFTKTIFLTHSYSAVGLNQPHHRLRPNIYDVKIFFLFSSFYTKFCHANGVSTYPFYDMDLKCGKECKKWAQHTEHTNLFPISLFVFVCILCCFLGSVYVKSKKKENPVSFLNLFANAQYLIFGYYSIQTHKHTHDKHTHTHTRHSYMWCVFMYFFSLYF
jgi:hypothetical protein